MINIGKINTLSVVKQMGSEIYLTNGGGNKVLLKDAKRPVNCQVGDSLNVFVYVDTDGHLAATTQVPRAQVDEFAWLKVVSVNYYGVFLDWGLAKDLLVPFSEQYHEMEVGKSYLVRLFLDDKNRIAATSKINRFLVEEADDFKAGEKVSLIIAEKTELGYKAIVNNTHWGLLYQNELFQSVSLGQVLDGYIRQIRDDKKIDLTLHQPGYGKVESLTDKILAKLQANNGILALSDKSSPEAIYETFGVSKKVYKQAIGALYKDHKIVLDKAGIRLP